MLSQHDRRALADIERHLRDSDPDLARRMEHPSEHEPARSDRSRGHIGRRVVLGALAAGLMLLAAAFATKSADAAVWAVVLLMPVVSATAACTVRRFRHRRD